MKQNVGIPLIIAAVVVVGLFIYFMAHKTLGPSQPPASANNMPDYAKQAAQGGKPNMTPYGQHPAGNGAGVNMGNMGGGNR